MPQHKRFVPEATSIVDALQKQFQAQPNVKLFTFLDDNGRELQSLTAGELHKHAQCTAVHLRDIGVSHGDRVLVVTTPGYDFVLAFFGTLYAGAIPVPCYPPVGDKNVTKLFDVGRDCELSVIFFSQDLYEMAQASRSDMENAFGQGSLIWTAPHLITIDDVSASKWQTPHLKDDDTAFIQYTSGSTSEPKGVVVTHRNILSHADIIGNAFGYEQGESCVSWLPPYHDMGLIGCIISPALGVTHSVLMSPLAFLRDPGLWLRTISRYRAAYSGGPNFAYDLVSNRAQLDNDIDLSCWRVAFSGAEPVRPSTIDQFCERFQTFGFSRSSMYPCYGLAEACLIVSGNIRGREPCPITIDADQYQQGHIVRIESEETNQEKRQTSSMTLVSSGYPDLTQPVIIVDPDQHHNLGTNTVGEIWISQSSTSPQAYWGKKDKTQEVFHASLNPDNGSRYTRSGDLGFLTDDGNLFVSGRIKDIIIVRGRNLYPQDMELTVDSTDYVRKGCCAVFSVDQNDIQQFSKQQKNDDQTHLSHEEQIWIVAEVQSDLSSETYGELCADIRRRIGAEHLVHVSQIVLVPHKVIPKTTSGKIQRAFTRSQLLQNKYNTLYISKEEAPVLKNNIDNSNNNNNDNNNNNSNSNSTNPDDLLTNASVGKIIQEMHQSVSEVTGRPYDQIDINTPLLEQGIDSLSLQALLSRLTTRLQRSIPPSLLFAYPSIHALAHHLASSHAPSHTPTQRSASDITDKLQQDNDIAIVGIGLRANGADKPHQFWDHLITGRDGVRGVPADRASRMPELGKLSGSFLSLEQLMAFDHEFFGISQRESLLMDPQQRIMLQVAWHALEDAGIPLDEPQARDTGVYVGVCASDHSVLHHAALPSLPHGPTAMALSVIPNRISYLLNLNGPSMAIDTACSSSLVAVHSACRALQAGDCDTALAGGVNVMLSPLLSESLRNAQFLSPDGRCKPYDAAADGYVRGEGAAAVVLKRVRDAIADGDRIYAVIQGSATRQDGRSNGLTAPNPEAQKAVIQRAMRQARVDAGDMGYVEGHGTGTYLGDPVEAAALCQTMGTGREGRPWYLGSVKGNLGHLEGAAGVFGLIKTALSLYHGQIPPSLHFHEPNPHIPFSSYALSVPTSPTPIPRFPFWAGVSSFGFGGTLAHAVLTSPPAPVVKDRPPSSSSSSSSEEEEAQEPTTLLLSSPCASGLVRLAHRYTEVLEHYPSRRPHLCRWSVHRRTHHPHYRIAVTASSAADMVSQLSSRVGAPSTSSSSSSASGSTPVLVFPGQGGAVWQGTATLYRSYPPFRTAIRRIDAALSHAMESPAIAPTGVTPPSSTGIRSFMEGEASDTALDPVQQQLLAFAVMLGLGHVWRDMLGGPPYAEGQDTSTTGTIPTSLSTSTSNLGGVMGHSLGEICAFQIAGGLTLDEAALVVTVRSLLLGSLSGSGAMVIARTSPTTAEAYCTAINRETTSQEQQVCVACENSPRSVTFSVYGDTAELCTRLFSDGISHKVLPVSIPFHNPRTRDLASALSSALSFPLRETTIPIYSSVSGARIPPSRRPVDTGHWVSNMTQPVRFGSAVMAAQEDGHQVFIEMSGRAMLSGAIHQNISSSSSSSSSSTLPCHVIPAIIPPHTHTITPALASAWSVGVSISRIALHPSGCPSSAHQQEQEDLPLFPFSPNLLIPPALGHASSSAASSSSSPDVNHNDATDPNTSSIQESVHHSVQEDFEQLQERLQSFKKAVEPVCAAYVATAWRSLGWDGEQPLHPPRIWDQLGIPGNNDDPHHRRQLDHILTSLQSLGYISSPDLPPKPTPQLLRAEQNLHSSAVQHQLDGQFPEFAAELRLLHRAGMSLPEVWTGRRSALEALFPGADVETAAAVYRTSPVSRLFNQMLASTVAEVAAVHRERGGRSGNAVGTKLRILEVGGGTGGATEAVLAAVGKTGCREYMFTDVSRAFLAAASSRFGSRHPMFRVGPLDVERSPAQQGYTPGSYDVVIAANVLHATQSIDTSLQHLRWLLAPHGTLLFMELEAPQLWLDLTFGMTDGWWRFADTARRPRYPLLPFASWSSALSDNGFTQITRMDPGQDGAPFQTVIAAVKEGDDARSNIDRNTIHDYPHHHHHHHHHHLTSTPSPQWTPESTSGLSEEQTSTILDVCRRLRALQEKDSITASEGNAMSSSSSSSSIRHAVETGLRELVAATLMVDPESVSMTEPLDRLGMDSLLALELRNTIERHLNITLPLAVLMENPTVSAITEVVLPLWSSAASGDNHAETERATDNHDDFVSTNTAGHGSASTAQEHGLDDDSGIEENTEAVGPVYILGSGTAVPMNEFDQDTMLSMAEIFYNVTDEEEKQRLRKIFSSASISRRHSVLPLSPELDYKNMFASLQDRNEVYEREAPELAFRSASAALEDWGGDRSAITHVVSVSTTGNKIPGIEFEVCERLGLDGHVERVAVNFMGCFGAVPGIRTASALARQSPRNRVLLISTEICTTHLEQDPTAENFVGAAIFSDGSAAMVLGGGERRWEGERRYWEVVRTAGQRVSESLDLMYWKLTNAGWKLGLSRHIPDRIFGAILPFTRRLLHGIPLDRCDFPIHPGGKAILLAIEKALNISKQQIRHSWHILDQYGNMSSATILFVLSAMQRDTSPLREWSCCMVFGPGLSIEGALLRRVAQE